MDRPHDSTTINVTVNEAEPFANGVIAVYLKGDCEEFSEVSRLRQKGWENEEADRHFEKQRHNADHASASVARGFRDMMVRIANQMNDTTGALVIRNPDSCRPSILDFCAAPGGFLKATLTLNPGAYARAFTLPVCSGGHKLLISPGVRAKFLDITMLAADMGVEDIPPEHPDALNFLPREFGGNQIYDLVLCDGQVLRTHQRADYREKREARRLILTQLALGLEHVRLHGTMVVLLHKVEMWDTVRLLYTFSKFSTVQLFKPTKGHQTRSSFYMVATDIDTTHPEVARAIDEWKILWRITSFGTEAEYKEILRQSESDVHVVLNAFGPELIRLGRDVWRLQAEALAKVSWTR